MDQELLGRRFLDVVFLFIQGGGKGGGVRADGWVLLKVEREGGLSKEEVGQRPPKLHFPPAGKFIFCPNAFSAGKPMWQQGVKNHEW